MKTYSRELHAEAACCIWECFIDWRMAVESRYPSGAPNTQAQAIAKLFETHGTVGMRHMAISLADLCCGAFDVIGSDKAEELGLIPYDWEFVPAFVEAAIVGALQTPEQVAARMIANAEARTCNAE